MSARARYPYGQQDAENSDLRHPGCIMSQDSSESTVFDRDCASGTVLTLNC